MTFGTVAGSGRVRARVPALELAFLGFVPMVLLVFLLVEEVARDSLGFDFRLAYYPAALDVLDGVSPYPALTDPALANEHAYVYPPLVAYAVTPFTLLPDGLAALVGLCLLVAGLGASMALLGVRDYRCYGAVALWSPTFDALQVVSVSAALVPVLALAWRLRDRAGRASALLGLAIAAKLFLAPLVLWQLSLRRVRAAVGAAVAATLLVLVPWGALGFADLGRYPSLLRELARLEQETCYSLVAAVVSLGASAGLARGLAFLVGAALIALAWRVGRLGQDARAFTLALAGAVALSPVVWQHYLVLFVVPLAVARPRFSWLWLAPGLCWVGWVGQNHALLRTASVAVAAAFVAALARSSHSPHRGNLTGGLPAEARP